MELTKKEVECLRSLIDNEIGATKSRLRVLGLAYFDLQLKFLENLKERLKEAKDEENYK